MKLRAFARLAGVRVIICGGGWGGKYGYTLLDAPNCQYCGFKSAKEAYEGWLKDTYPEKLYNAMLKLLEEK